MKDEWSGKKARQDRGARQGSGTLEILIAFAILILAITAGISVAFGNQRLNVDTELDHQGFYKASRELEKLRAVAGANFDAVSSSPAAVLATSEGAYNSIFTRTIGVLSISPCAKQVTSTIAWQTDPLRPQKTELSTLLTSPATLFALGGDCAVTPPKDGWKNPVSNGSIDFNPAGNQGTDVDVVKKGGLQLAMVTSKTGAAAKDDFWVINVNNPAAPAIIGHANTGPGLNALDVAGNYAFVANGDTFHQLQVIDVSVPSSPLVIASTTLPSVTVPAISIAYYNSRVYLGTQNNPGSEFYIFSVADPFHPQPLGNIELGRDVNEIVIDDDIAYLATSANTAEVTVLNVASPGAITQAGSFDAKDTDGGANSEDGTSLYLLNPYLYLGRQRAPGAKARDFYILNVSTPATPTVAGSKRLNLNPNTEVSGIFVSGKFAFLGTTDSNAGFQVWNVGDPVNIIAPSSCNLYNYSEKASGLDFMEDNVYVANESNNALRIIRDNSSGTCT